jgi:hypothetical protein
LGYPKSSPPLWFDFNIALSQTALLVVLLAEKFNFVFRSYSIELNGNQTEMKSAQTGFFFYYK